MTVLKCFLLIVIASTLYFVLNMKSSNVVSDDVNLKRNDDIEVNRKNDNKWLPDYDPRKIIKKVGIPKQDIVLQVSDDNLDEVIHNLEKELQVTQSKYNQVLDDPIAKKDLENQAKKIGIEYKKALLVKIKSGQL